MDIHVKQKADYQGKDWWRWSVWVDGPKEELDQIEYIQYTLHPTFPKPVHCIKNRRTKFRLNSSGWGEFMIYVNIKRKDGGVLNTEHWLKLEYPLPKKKYDMTSSSEHPTVFLSSSIADMSFTYALRKALNAEEIEVVTTNDLELGSSLEASLRSLLDRVDTGVVIISDKLSPWVTQEIEEMQKRKMPLTPVLLGQAPKSANLLRSLNAVKAKDIDDAKAVARNVAERIKKGRT